MHQKTYIILITYIEKGVIEVIEYMNNHSHQHSNLISFTIL